MTLKHYLLGLGLHNLMGQKLSIRILSLLGHTVTYDSVTSAETVIAEASQLLYEEATSGGLKPASKDG